MIKFIMNVLQLIIITKIGYSILRWMLKGKRRNKKSITRKITGLVSNKIHYHLDNALKNQESTIAYPSDYGKVIPFRKTK